MIQSLFIHELKLTLSSKKNLLFLAFLALLILSYSYMVLPDKEHIETVNQQELANEIEKAEIQQEWRRDRGYTGTGSMTGPHYSRMEYYVNVNNKMLSALDNKDYRRYLHLRLHYLQNGGYKDYQDSDIFNNSPIPGKDKRHLYSQTMERFQSYIDQDEKITYPMVVEKTSLQQLQQLLLSTFTYLIIFAAIYFSSDVLTKDLRHKSLLRGNPMNWNTIINVKSIVAFLYSILAISALIGFGLLVISLKFGLGHFDLQIITNKYEYMPISSFFLKSFSLLLMIIYLFTRLNVLLSLFTRHAGLVLLISTSILALEFLYLSRTTRQLLGTDISNFPQTYFDFGKVVTGHKNFLLNIDTVTYTQGLTVLFISVIAVEILVFVSAKIVPKRQFFKS